MRKECREEGVRSAGEGVCCEHGKCNACMRCRTCERLDRAHEDLGNELLRMSKEEPSW